MKGVRVPFSSMGNSTGSERVCCPGTRPFTSVLPWRQVAVVALPAKPFWAWLANLYMAVAGHSNLNSETSSVARMLWCTRITPKLQAVHGRGKLSQKTGFQKMVLPRLAPHLTLGIRLNADAVDEVKALLPDQQR